MSSKKTSKFVVMPSRGDILKIQGIAGKFKFLRYCGYFGDELLVEDENGKRYGITCSPDNIEILDESKVSKRQGKKVTESCEGSVTESIPEADKS